MYKGLSLCHLDLNFPQSPHHTAFCLSIYGITTSFSKSHIQKAGYLGNPLEPQFLTFHALGI